MKQITELKDIPSEQELADSFKNLQPFLQECDEIYKRFLKLQQEGKLDASIRN